MRLWNGRHFAFLRSLPVNRRAHAPRLPGPVISLCSLRQCYLSRRERRVRRRASSSCQVLTKRFRSSCGSPLEATKWMHDSVERLDGTQFARSQRSSSSVDIAGAIVFRGGRREKKKTAGESWRRSTLLTGLSFLRVHGLRTSGGCLYRYFSRGPGPKQEVLCGRGLPISR